MRTCPLCQTPKPPEDFYQKGLGKIHTYCKKCSATRAKAYAAANRSAYNARKSAAIDRNMEVVYQHLLSHPCEKCGERDPLVLEFDHLDPKLKFKDVGYIAGGGYSLAKLLEEIAKCRVLCANCHRRHTAKQRQYRFWKRTENEKLRPSPSTGQYSSNS